MRNMAPVAREEPFMKLRPDPTFHASPKLAMEATAETLAFTLMLRARRTGDFVRDDDGTGFGVRVIPGGARTCRFPYRKGGRTRRASIRRDGSGCRKSGSPAGAG